MKKKLFSMHIDPSMFEPASEEEKQELIIPRKNVSYWKDAWRRLRKNPMAVIGLGLILLSLLFAFVGPLFIPYKYDQQIRGYENLAPFQPRRSAPNTGCKTAANE